MHFTTARYWKLCYLLEVYYGSAGHDTIVKAEFNFALKAGIQLLVMYEKYSVSSPSIQLWLFGHKMNFQSIYK